MPKIKIYLCYEGTFFSGWQRQKNTPNTIQEIIENKLSMIANTRVDIHGSGRTDAGVHARIQVAHAAIPESMRSMLDPVRAETGSLSCRLQQSLNSLLPPDIRILMTEVVEDDFHAQMGVKKKTYVYFINPNPIQLPELRDMSWHLRLPVNWTAIDEATRLFEGEHDFKAYCSADTDVKSTVRTIHEIFWGDVAYGGIAARCNLRALRITGNGFLRTMVRSIVGSLMHVGNGKTSVANLKKALDEKNRKLAGPTAPPHGLWLWDILY